MTKNFSFILIQSEFGDLYRVTLETTNSSVHGIGVQYFDTINPCTSLNIMRVGYLFAAGEFNNHFLYQIQDLGDTDPNPVRTHSASQKKDALVTFNPRGDPLNLISTDEF